MAIHYPNRPQPRAKSIIPAKIIHWPIKYLNSLIIHIYYNRCLLLHGKIEKECNYSLFCKTKAGKNWKYTKNDQKPKMGLYYYWDDHSTKNIELL